MSIRELIFGKDYTPTREEDKLYHSENIIYNMCEDLLVIMEDLEVSKKDLADKMGDSEESIRDLLSGYKAMTVDTFFNMCFELGVKVDIKLSVNGGLIRELNP